MKKKNRKKLVVKSAGMIVRTKIRAGNPCPPY
jgi:hypothetical protein